MEHQVVIDTIMNSDENIRYATICNKDGEFQISREKKGLERYLSPEETIESLKNASKAWRHSRAPLFKKIGKGLYTLTTYEKLKRITIPLENEFLLLVTMDNTGTLNKSIDRIVKMVHEDHS